ncbi:MAG: hypothetical protein R3C11_01295 [Planctomycetaceae bacterium]
MNNVATFLPENQDEVRNRLYQGEIYLLPANEASLALTDAVLVLIRDSLGDDFHKSHEQYDSDDFFQRIGKLRKAHLYLGRISTADRSSDRIS